MGLFTKGSLDCKKELFGDMQQEQDISIGPDVVAGTQPEAAAETQMASDGALVVQLFAEEANAGKNIRSRRKTRRRQGSVLSCIFQATCNSC